MSLAVNMVIKLFPLPRRNFQGRKMTTSRRTHTVGLCIVGVVMKRNVLSQKTMSHLELIRKVTRKVIVKREKDLFMKENISVYFIYKNV